MGVPKSRNDRRVISVENLRFAYPEQEVLKGLDFELQAGAVLCLAGPNGCGKTTLIDCLLGSNRPLSGRIDINGVDPVCESPSLLARQAAYVPQIHERTFPYTVFQIVLMGRTPHLQAFRSPSRRDRELTAEVLEQIGLAHLAQRPYTQLSGGECQLVMLARALVQEAPVIIMDEPTAHLDYHNEMLFLEVVRQQVAEKRVAVVMATHAPNHAFYFIDAGINTEIAMMKDGGFYARGNPLEVLTVENVRAVYRVDARLVDFQNSQDRPARHLIALGISSEAGAATEQKRRHRL